MCLHSPKTRVSGCQMRERNAYHHDRGGKSHVQGCMLRQSIMIPAVLDASGGKPTELASESSVHRQARQTNSWWLRRAA